MRNSRSGGSRSGKRSWALNGPKLVEFEHGELQRRRLVQLAGVAARPADDGVPVPEVDNFALTQIHGGFLPIAPPGSHARRVLGLCAP